MVFINGYISIKRRRFVSFALALVFSAFSAINAFAGEVYAREKVNFRATPSLSADIIQVIPLGEAVNEAERLANGWSNIIYGGFSGYVYSEFLTASFPERFAYATDNVNFRAEPSTSAGIIALLEAGTRVFEKEKLPGGWSKVVYDAQTGFVKSEFLRGAPPEREMLTYDKVNLRSAPSTDAPILDVLDFGTAVVEKERLSNGWSQVAYGAQGGFIKSEFLTATPPEREMKTLDRVNLRSAPSSDAPIVDVLGSGASVTERRRFENGYSYVSFKGVAGYIFNEYLGTEQMYQSGLPAGGAAAPSAKPKAETARSAVYTPIKEISASGVELVDWQTVKGFFPTGTDCLVTDVWTGRQYYIRCFSKGNHADVEPSTANDTAVMKSTYGGVWSWDTRPVWVTVNGRTLAASINGMPHGGGVVSGNGMDGQICLHFRGSKTHNGNTSHENEHQAAITIAWNAANK